ncbi:unnamed protein product [Haemonchus placei]|uniref:Insulin-degrading enzyme n=1 Tax=Haemonchus placei TaxID=6290 RepID=A0A158QQQ6_HAEPC|nr:unnamed protein product [Haemonchus placei]
MTKDIVLSRHNDIVKSAEDQRQYRGLELTNGLKVLLVSDPTTDSSAAAMDVGVGYLMDPWELPGLAHFCEHMLFLGTDKYPLENEFNKFISAHAGITNAYTATDHTNYHFNVRPHMKLAGALDRFVQFFLAPQFTESATEREQDDRRRKLQVERFLSKPGHDYGKFGTGNKKTLMDDARKNGIEPREALLNFHKQWYSANIMSLCIVGSELLDEMEAYLGTLGFDAIENKQVKPMEWENPYGREQLGRRVEIVPIEDIQKLAIRFPTKMIQEKSSPSRYISHLLNHEGKGSLLSELKRLGWASSLSAGRSNPAEGMSTFDIDLHVSDGLNHTEDIISLVFNYVGLLKRTGAAKWVQDELNKLGELKFRFKGTMNRFQAAIETVHPALHIPEENEYIPTKFDLKPRASVKSEHPRVIYDDVWCRIWFKQDDEYKLPKMVTKVGICRLGNSLNSDPLRFEVILDRIKRLLENLAHSQPYDLSNAYLDMLLADKCWCEEQLLAVSEDINVHELEAFVKEILRAFHVELFVHGNATEQARDAYVYRHFQNTHEMSCVKVLFQAGIQTSRGSALVELLAQLLREPAFNQLRTVEQLGYIVAAGSRLNTAGVLGLQFIVQGPKSPDYVFDRIEAFIENIRDEITKMSQDEFDKQKMSVIARALEKPKTLGAQSRHFWIEIRCRQYDFDLSSFCLFVLFTLFNREVCCEV